jgi:hypothetical protein
MVGTASSTKNNIEETGSCSGKFICACRQIAVRAESPPARKTALPGVGRSFRRSQYSFMAAPTTRMSSAGPMIPSSAQNCSSSLCAAFVHEEPYGASFGFACTMGLVVAGYV